MNKTYDAIVVGYGPCGVSCAVYLKRYGYQVLVIGKDLGALEKAHKIENFYGVEPISGIDLAKKGLEQLKSFEIDTVTEEVLDINPFDGNIITTNKNTYQAKAIMLALGSSKSKLSPAIFYEGKGVSYCATCDGFFYRKKKAGIVGTKEYMLHELEVLHNMIPDLTLFTDGKPLEVEIPEGIKIVTDKIEKCLGEEKLTGVVAGGITYDIDGLFIALGSASAFSLAKHMGLELEKDYIKVNEHFETNIPGVYAGGDCTGGLLQVSKAVSDGANAALSIHEFLKKNK